MRRLLVAPLAVLSVLALGAAHVPTPALIGPLLVGIVYALTAGPSLTLPRAATWLAMVTLGVGAGATMTGSTLRSLASNWAPVLIASVAALLVSVVLAGVLVRIASLDPATSVLGMLPGGAPGMVVLATETDADERLVATMQYLRVVLIISTTPFVADLFFDVAARPLHGAVEVNWGASLAVLGLAALASLAARPLSIPGGPVIVALVVAATAASLGADAVPPPLLVDAALVLIGLDVGLRFTPASLRRAGTLVPAAGALIALMIGLSALLGIGLSVLADVSWSDGYLATTPGGLSAVLALTLATGSNLGFVVPVQIFRMLLMLVAAPFLVRWLVRRQGVAARAG